MPDSTFGDGAGNSPERSQTKRTRLSGKDNRPPNPRGPTACDKCRERKTKCDNARPSCGYCSKHLFPCVYSDDGIAAPWDKVGDRVLEAIDQLSNRVLQQRCVSCLRAIDNNINASRNANSAYTPQGHGTQYSTIASPGIASDGIATTPSDEVRVKAQGTDSILEWPILTDFKSPDCLFADDTLSSFVSDSIPNISRNELLRLADKYIDGVHIKNPILDLSELESSISHVCENGLDWSTKTCLVMLVCAIGAITQKYYQHRAVGLTDSTADESPSFDDSDSDPSLSLQFWNIAAKRLGLVIAGQGIQEVQCLCLAAIYQMHHMQPLEAWKHFNLAAASWIAVTLTHSGSNKISLMNTSKSFTMMQSLYFTIWKSECELHLEIDVPSPMLSHVDFPYSFPSPPNADQPSPAHDVTEAEKIWYYYLAEIAARHLINRIIGTNSTDEWPLKTENIPNMIRRAELLESQVMEWQRSLPYIFQFEVPTGFETAAHPDDLTQILRHRYLTCRELIARPFVRICLESPMDIDPYLRFRVTKFASEDIRLCLLKISQVVPHFHQGTWYGIRNLATAVLILSAVYMAKQVSWLPGAQEVVLPADWRDRSLTAMDCFSPVWSMKAGGVSNIYNVLQRVLSTADTSEGSSFAIE